MTWTPETSAQRKLARGIEHAKRLRSEALAYENAKAYSVRIETEQRPGNEIAYDVFAVERKPTPDHWPLLAGDAIQNLRASLEHAVHAASGRRTKSQYPIFIDRCEFQVKGRPMLTGVPAPIRALIEAAQPYETITAQPKVDALYTLGWLARLDKHRNLTTVASVVETPYISHDGIDVNFTDSGEGRQLKEGTKVMAFTVSGATEPDEVNVYPDFTYQVAVEGRSLVGVLQFVVFAAFKGVAECETGKPLPMLTPDPFSLVP